MMIGGGSLGTAADCTGTGPPPSERGAPGALGFIDGSNASPRRPGTGRRSGSNRRRQRRSLRRRPSGRHRGLRRHIRLRRRRSAALRAQLLLKLLVAELKLLDRAGELPDLRFQLIDADGHLRLVGTAALLLTLLTAEQIVEEVPGPLLLRAAGGNSEHGGEHRRADHIRFEVNHRETVACPASG